jgi:hypothetical protein
MKGLLTDLYTKSIKMLNWKLICTSIHSGWNEIYLEFITITKVTALFQTIYVHMGDEDEGMIS